MTAASHIAPAVAWSLLLPWWLALVVTFTFWALTARRVQKIFSDPRRSRWVTRLVDVPMFVHFGAGFMALPLFAFGALLVGGSSLTGCAPAALAGDGALQLREAAFAAFAAGLGLTGWGAWVRRRRVVTHEVEVELAGLHPELDGYRVVQLSDLHIGSYDDKARGLEWTRMANELRPDLLVVTGDLVTSGTDYYEDVADVLGSLRARDGVFVVMGNHDQWNNDALTRAIVERGPRVLKNEHVNITRGGGAFTLAGVDDAFSGNDDIERTLADRPANVPTILLAHYPSFFREAAERGVELTLSGHTHGGQFGVPFLADRWNLARAVGQPSRGLERRGESALYVNAGLGTTGPPVRIGVAPEIAVLVLRTSGNERGAS
ncbi:MAG: metallophosphoesterase [Myxococcales bacterium]|nr:metallophosphoesterase [Myxococcales bacterium]